MAQYSINIAGLFASEKSVVALRAMGMRMGLMMVVIAFAHCVAPWVG
jgi:hypothetical protein